MGCKCKCLTRGVCVQGDHKGGEVDSRLLFRIDYCLPDCALKGSQGKQEEQQLNKVSQVRERNKSSFL